MTIQKTAADAASYFETALRADGANIAGDSNTVYVRLKDGAPEWVTDLVHDAHGDMLPDDWRYSVIQDALETIADSDDPEDASGEFADSQVDV